MNFEKYLALILNFFLTRCLVISEEYEDASFDIRSSMTHTPTLPPVNTSIISSILERLTNKSVYDKRLRPQYGGNCVDVGITIHVSSISAVSEVNMDFTLDFYLRQTWQDTRLAFANVPEKLDKAKFPYLQVGVDYLEKLWKPDTFFPNEKKASFHAATTHNSFLRIYQTGYVLTSQRLTVTATCPMNLKLFPMDTQKCQLEIESYGFTTSAIHYHWCELMYPDCKNPVQVEVNNITLPNYRIAGICMNQTVANTTSGNYSRLRVQFTLDRDSAFSVLQIYLPASMVVILTWISFWISSDSAPSRTTIGTMTVLTETHLLIGTNRRLPPVSYLKAVDVYLGGCYFFVVMVLIEYACVAYCRKKNEDVRKRKTAKNKARPPQTATLDLLRGTHAHAAACTCQKGPRFSLAKIIAKPNKDCPMHSQIDYYSRFAFPAAFFTFNIAYWLILLCKADYIGSSEESELRC